MTEFYIVFIIYSIVLISLIRRYNILEKKLLDAKKDIERANILYSYYKAESSMLKDNLNGVRQLLSELKNSNQKQRTNLASLKRDFILSGLFITKTDNESN